MPDENVVILGGGIGGLVASNVLKTRLGDRATVTVVERKKQFQFPPSYPWLMLGWRKPEQVQKDLSPVKKRGIEVVNDEVQIIDIEKKDIRTKEDEFSYDHLIVALGAEYAPNTIPGFEEHAHHIYDLDSAIRFQDVVESFEGGTVAVGVSRIPFKCPAAPYEVALLLDYHYTKKGIRDKVTFQFFTPEGVPLPAAPPDIGSKVLEFFESRGINYHLKLKLTEVRPRELHFENGRTIPFDLLFCVPPHRAPGAVAEAGLTDETGWIPVNPETLETKHENVYAIGDVTSLPTPEGYVPYLPKAGVFAHGQAEVVANNIAVKIKGGGELKKWDGWGECFLETGYGKSGFVEGAFIGGPKPEFQFYTPSRMRHMQKVLFEKYWMHHWFTDPWLARLEDLLFGW
ncbi:MAG: NAD(P)/FAD-dependent oxidoreductase, partial [Candidatus Geothermarchaeales archaeon]